MNGRRQYWIAVTSVGFALCAAACSSGGSSSKASAGDSTTLSTPALAGSSAGSGTTAASGGALTGTWTGSWQRTSPPPGSGTNTVTFHQQGNDLTGTLVAAGSACLTTHQISGSVNGTAINFHVVSGSTTASYTGTVSGTSMSGTATVTCSVGTGTASWQLTRR